MGVLERVNTPRICASRGRVVNGSNKKWTQQLEMGKENVSNALTTVQTDNLVVEPNVEVVGNYSPSGHNASRIISTGGGRTWKI